jgi:hypothetical protein
MAEPLLREHFDKLTEAQKTEHLGAGGWVTDSIPNQEQASAPRRSRWTLAKSRFNAMTPDERAEALADGAIVED